jgi:uncharacterized membrane protein
MLRKAIRTAAVSVLVGGAAFLAVPASAQDATTTVAPVAEVAVEAPVADTAAPVDAAVAEVPAGGVAAGGGFISNDNGSTVLPIALALGAAGVGAGIFVSRRRKA